MKAARENRERVASPPNEIVPFYIRVPRSVVAASRPLARSSIEPLAACRTSGLPDDFQLRWLPAEDELLATGILNYGINWELIHRTLLPTKSVKQIIQRQKNLCNSTGSRRQLCQDSETARDRRSRSCDNQEALFRDGARSGAEDWHRLCSRFLPTRHPSCLERLWREAHPDGPPVSYPLAEPTLGTKRGRECTGPTAGT